MLDDRRVLCGILFVLHTGIQWEWLPKELGFGSGMTCWRRLRDWNNAGVWQRLHEVLLDDLRATGRLDLSRAVIDSSHIRALKGGPKTGRSPVDRGRPGSKHHVICDATGIPLAVTVTGGNRNDITQLIPLLAAVPRIRSKRGRPRQRPGEVYADRGYDHDSYRRQVWARASSPSSPAAAPNMALDWEPDGGSSSRPSRCCTGSVVCASAGRPATTSTKPS